MSMVETPESLSPERSGESAFFLRRLMRWLRRLHLYCGLCFLPWVLLYAITAILFNHPGLFSDAPMVMFDRESARDTSLEPPLDPNAMAEEVIAALNRLQNPTPLFELDRSRSARFNREFAFATVASDEYAINVLVDVANGGGTIRVAPKLHVVPSAPAPFAVTPGARKPLAKSTPAEIKDAGREADIAASAVVAGLMLDHPFHERMKSAIPNLLERNGIPAGVVTVTSVPDLVFNMRAEGKEWSVTYSPMTGAVAGRPPEFASEPVSIRRFLLRLHTAHGYAGSAGAKWWWALIVDAMAAVLIFWCASGLIMWWQIKSTRLVGLALLILSSIAAGVVALGMYPVVT